MTLSFRLTGSARILIHGSYSELVPRIEFSRVKMLSYRVPPVFYGYRIGR